MKPVAVVVGILLAAAVVSVAPAVVAVAPAVVAVAPAVVVTAQRILDAPPTLIQVVPLTSTLRGFHTEVVIEPDPANGLGQSSAAQCQHVRAVSPARVAGTIGNVGPLALLQIRETIAVIIDLP